MTVDTYRPQPSNFGLYFKRYTFLLIGILMLVSIITLIILLIESGSSSAKFTEKDILAAARKFVSYSSSLDSANIEEHQLRGLAMISDPALHKERLLLLKTTDIVTKVKNHKRNIYSRLDWDNISEEIINIEGGRYTVDISTPILMNERRVAKIHLIITLAPVEITAENVTGFGVVALRDLAKNPLVEK